MVVLPRVQDIPLFRQWNARLQSTVIVGSLMTAATLSTGCATTTAGRPPSAAADSVTALLARERAVASTATSNAVGVTPFAASSKSTTIVALGYALADLLTTDLARSSRLQLVERARLADVLKELDFAKSGRVDPGSAPQVGKLLQAHQLVLGGIDTMPGGELRLSLRVADVETGELHEAIDARAPMADILAAEKQIAFRLFETMGVTLTPAERSSIEARQTSNIAALVAYGRGVQAELSGDKRRAVDEYQRAVRFDASFRAASDRAADVRASVQADAGQLMPGLRSIDAPVTGAVDRLNRPLDIVTSVSRPLSGAGDPAFPGTMVTVLITIRRP